MAMLKTIKSVKDIMYNDIFYNLLNASQNNEENYDIIDQKYIKNILKKWKIKDFGIDENGHISNKYAQEEIANIINRIAISIEVNKNDYLKNKSKTEQENIFNYTFTIILMLYRLCESIYLFFYKNIEKSNDEFEVLSKLTAYLLSNFRGLLNSYFADDFLTVIQKNRIIYECYVIFLFIKKYPELAKEFINYTKILQYQIVRKEYKNNISEKKTIEKIENLGKNWSEQKGDNWGNYGWTKNIIPDKKSRNLEYIVSNLKLDEKLGSAYKLSSNYIHPNSFSVFKYPDKKFTTLSMRISADILVNQIIQFTEFVCTNKIHSTLINSIINSFKNKCFEVIDESI
jgi:hypothetical protein